MQRISSWLWFCCSALRGFLDWVVTLGSALAWLAFTGATKLLTIAEDCTCCWIVGLSLYDSIEASLLWTVTLPGRLLWGWLLMSPEYSAMWSEWADQLSYSCGRVNFPRCVPQRDIAVPHRVSFLGFATMLGNSGFAFPNISWYIWLHIFPDYKATHTLRLANYLCCHGGRQDDFSLLALEGQCIPGRSRFIQKQYLPLPYLSGFLGLARQSRASDRTKQSEEDFRECRLLTASPKTTAPHLRDLGLACVF